MTIKIQCPRCEQRISATEDVLGTVVECPTCNHQFEAVAMGAPAAAPNPPPIIEPDSARTAATDLAASPPPIPEEHAHRGPAPHARPSHPKPIVLRAPERRSGTMLTVVCAIAVVAGGLYWWQTQGPGLTEKGAASRAVTKREKAGEQATEPGAAGASATTTGTAEEPYQGVWRGTVPRTVIAKPYDVVLTITYNERGEGFPKFETPESDADAFKDARLATLFQSGGKTKVILLRQWEVSLSEDKKTMTWSEVDGPATVKFTKQ